MRECVAEARAWLILAVLVCGAIPVVLRRCVLMCVCRDAAPMPLGVVVRVVLGVLAALVVRVAQPCQ